MIIGVEPEDEIVDEGATIDVCASLIDVAAPLQRNVSLELFIQEEFASKL